MAKARTLRSTSGVKLKDRFALASPAETRSARKALSKKVVGKIGAKSRSDGTVIEVLEFGSTARAFTKWLKPAGKPRKTQSHINQKANARDRKRRAKSARRAKKAWIPVAGNFNG